MTTEAEVTATPMNEKSVIVVGRPRSWPHTCAFWSRAYRERSGMFSASVAQKPTIAVSEGTNTARNAPVDVNRLGCDSTGPNPPARLTAQASNARPDTIRKGAAHTSSALIASLPRTITAMFRSQNARNPSAMAKGGSHCGTATFIIVWMACPPIHVWMPNQPQATTDRIRAGTLDPWIPNEARASTGNGIP